MVQMENFGEFRPRRPGVAGPPTNFFLLARVVCEIFHVLLEKNVIQFVYILGQIATVSIKCEYEFTFYNFL